MLTLAALASCDPEADALYSAYGYGAAPYAYAGYHAPLLRPAVAVRQPVVAAVAAPLVRNVVAPVAQIRAAPAPAVAASAPVVAAVAPAVVAEARAAVPTITSSQYHSQDEDKNFSFGYSNINSARQESGNAYTGVVGSYSDGRNTINYVADQYGYRAF